jgi:hypothetical protein
MSSKPESHVEHTGLGRHPTGRRRPPRKDVSCREATRENKNQEREERERSPQGAEREEEHLKS